MEDSANQALYTGVYVFIFVIAISATILLFSAIINYAELSYEYGDTTVNSNIIENIPTTKYKLLTGSDVIAIIYNYMIGDKYENAIPDTNYKIEFQSGTNLANLNLSSSYGRASYNQIKEAIGSYSNLFVLEYKSVDSTGVPTILIRPVNEGEIIEE